jgi:hypothetical protein
MSYTPSRRVNASSHASRGVQQALRRTWCCTGSRFRCGYRRLHDASDDGRCERADLGHDCFDTRVVLFRRTQSSGDRFKRMHRGVRRTHNPSLKTILASLPSWMRYDHAVECIRRSFASTDTASAAHCCHRSRNSRTGSDCFKRSSTMPGRPRSSHQRYDKLLLLRQPQRQCRWCTRCGSRSTAASRT